MISTNLFKLEWKNKNKFYEYKIYFQENKKEYEKMSKKDYIIS